ncbi:MAG: hypothetical protein JWO13_822 [Acidobacteriales bacterium]|nr:hypothetical protein [Terriglobales bacterium]
MGKKIIRHTTVIQDDDDVPRRRRRGDNQRSFREFLGAVGVALFLIWLISHAHR